MEYTITIGGVDYTDYVSLPFTETYALDEALDSAVLNLKYMSKSDVFKPYTKVVIDYGDDTSIYYVAQDNVTNIIGGEYYNHELALIEETKILEKIVVDTNTITQPLIHTYERAKAVISRRYYARTLLPTSGYPIEENNSYIYSLENYYISTKYNSSNSISVTIGSNFFTKLWF